MTKKTTKAEETKQEVELVEGAGETERRITKGSEQVESKEVAKVEDNNPLSFLADYYTEDELQELTGMDSIKASDISIPYATLISKDADKGNLVLPSGKVIKGWSEMEGDLRTLKGVTILNIQPVRIMFPDKFNPSNSYICRSLDGDVGAPDGEYAGRECTTCEFSQYPEGGGASPCRDQRLLLCATETETFHLIISGVGMKVFKNFLTQQLLSNLPKVKNLWAALRFDINIDRTATDYGDFPVMRFSIDEKNPMNDKDTIINYLNVLKSYREFAVDHYDSAAQASKVQMAAGEAAEDSGGSGQNTGMF